MRLKIIVIFLLTILIPTALLAYFGLLAVRSEQSIIEGSMKERYEFMVDIVVGEIKTTLSDMPEKLLNNRQYLESVLFGKAAIFKDQVVILDSAGRPISGPIKSFVNKKKELGNPVLTRAMMSLPYTIAVYERYPLPLLEKLKERKKKLYLYVAIISFSALSILGGGFFTLWALSGEWRLAELKSEFVSILSHDLRRPLTSIRMFSEMLKDNRLPSEEKRLHYYNIINSESERLTHLANNILDFSRIESGRKIYDFKPEVISKVVNEAIQHFRTYMMDEISQINLNTTPDLPILKIDANAISQALINLLANAVKFSPLYKEIHVNLIRGKKEVIIEIIDQGIGVPRSEQKRIFRKFYRTSQKQVVETEGSGIGLMLVKYIAEAHRGSVKVESDEGKGSKFSLILPI